MFVRATSDSYALRSRGKKAPQTSGLRVGEREKESEGGGWECGSVQAGEVGRGVGGWRWTWVQPFTNQEEIITMLPPNELLSSLPASFSSPPKCCIFICGSEADEQACVCVCVSACVCGWGVLFLTAVLLLISRTLRADQVLRQRS